MSSQNLSAYDQIAASLPDTPLQKRAYDRARLDVVAGAAQSGRPVLDAGCGIGAAATHLVGLGHRVLGIDQSPSMIERAKTRVPQAEFHVGRIEELRFGQGAFAGIVALESLIHFERTQMANALRDLARMITPGGPLLFTVFQGEGETEYPLPTDDTLNLRTTLYARKEIEAVVAELGVFDRVRVEGRRPYPFEPDLHWIFVTARRNP